MSAHVKWEEPPPAGVGRGGFRHIGDRWSAAAAELRERPNAWALLGEASTALVTQINRGRGHWAPKGAYEATSREQNGRTAKIYARFIGGAA